jgi:hypothetical protein
VKINAFAGSAVIEYDPKLIPSDLWEDFGRVGNDPWARARIKSLLEAGENGDIAS